MAEYLLRIEFSSVHDAVYHIAVPGATTEKGKTSFAWVDPKTGGVLWYEGMDGAHVEAWPLMDAIETYERHWEANKAAELAGARPRVVKIAKGYLDNLTNLAKGNPGMTIWSSLLPGKTRMAVAWNDLGYIYRFGDYQCTFDDALGHMVTHVEKGGKVPDVNKITE